MSDNPLNPISAPPPHTSATAYAHPSLVGVLDHGGMIYDTVALRTALAVGVILLGQIAPRQSRPFDDTSRAAFLIITIAVVVVVIVWRR